MSQRRPAEVTVAELTVQGVDAVEASCGNCAAEWLSPITFLPPATTLSKVAALMICPTCGGREIEVALMPTCAGATVH
jgi:Zn finger protein HypA/HybF involved in hydrogenase expression